VRTISAADVPGLAEAVGALGGTQVHRFEPPPQRPPGKVLTGEPAEMAAQVVKLLREEAKVV
ncbi:MAG TPA: electron transfer flavoprotein subunit beta, partial [Phycisphaerae bacterium]|nr:electron transfer flavoprotein subunit beta [Phycisphaerae bacterium]